MIVSRASVQTETILLVAIVVVALIYFLFFRNRASGEQAGSDRGAPRIGDRREAIRAAVRAMQAGDVVLVAGKGHETGQIVGDTVLPFSDRDELTAALDEVH